MSETTTFRYFSRQRPRIFFAIDGEEFDARKALSPTRLQEAMHEFQSVRGDEDEVDVANVMGKLTSALKLMLKPESFLRFIAAMEDEDRDEPIDVPQLTDIFTWLIEQYSQRPTQALSDSSISLSTGNAGTDSPAGVQPPESIL